MRLAHVAFSICTAFALNACGLGGESPAYIHESLTSDSRSPWAGTFDINTGDIQFLSKEDQAPRDLAIARYPEPSRARPGSSTCLVDVAPEKDANIRTELLTQLSRGWHKYFKPNREQQTFPTFDPYYKDFQFDFAGQSAFLSGTFLAPAESIHYKRLCLSRELIRSDAYNGMRIIELEAQNNEGIAYFAFRFKRRNDDMHRSALLMTHRKYVRYGQIARNLESVDSTFAPISDQALGVPIAVYLEN